MTDEFTLRKATDRMAKADALLRNETLIETLDSLEAAYTAAWKATDARDDDGRQRCWFAFKALEGFREDLRRTVTDGKVAMAELNEMEDRARRAKPV